MAAQRAAVAGLQGMAAWRVAARVVEWVAVDVEEASVVKAVVAALAALAVGKEARVGTYGYRSQCSRCPTRTLHTRRRAPHHHSHHRWRPDRCWCTRQGLPS